MRCARLGAGAGVPTPNWRLCATRLMDLRPWHQSCCTQPLKAQQNRPSGREERGFAARQRATTSRDCHTIGEWGAAQAAPLNRRRPRLTNGVVCSQRLAACPKGRRDMRGAPLFGHLSRKRQVRYHVHARRHGSMAEQRFCKPWVGGSTPSAGSRIFFEAAPSRGAASCVARSKNRPLDLRMW